MSHEDPTNETTRSPHEPPDPDRGAPVRSASARHAAYEWLWTLLAAALLFFTVRAFIVEAFRIPSGSMENTLLAGDFVLVNKAIYGARVPLTPFRLPGFVTPTRGDVIVFEPPHEAGKTYVKRLIGMPGDTVEMRRKTLYVNRQRAAEPYARHSDTQDLFLPDVAWQCRFTLRAPGRKGCHPSRDNWGPIVVPADGYLVLGDNRDDSEDSRYWGFVPVDAIRGRPLVVYYSYKPEGTGTAPWLTRVRWDRIGHRVD